MLNLHFEIAENACEVTHQTLGFFSIAQISGLERVNDDFLHNRAYSFQGYILRV